ncbi:MAG: endonuclease/exonuclease/phosphatase family protein, partial [Bacteroidales bacterium]|nr:endonuclease/exonuclease/phosphatase family protein [Bacteroidales bacterium]
MKGKFKFLFLISLFYYTCAFAQENTTVVASRIDSANSSEDVKIISFNIRNSTSPEQDGNNCWSNRRDGAVRVVSDELPDAFGIQEGTLHQVKYFEKYCPEYTRVGIGRDDGKDGGEFMAIFFLSSKYDLISCGTFWLSETPDTVSKGWDAACKRTATWVRLRNKSDGSELYYFNTHLDHMGVTARFESAKLLNSRIHKIAGDDAAVILGGDFNVSPENEVVAIFHSYLADSRDSA